MGRLKKFLSIIFNPKFFGILSFVYGILSFVRDEFLPLDLSERFRLGGMLNIIDWYWWAIGGVVIWALSVAWVSTKNRGEEKIKPIGYSKKEDIANFTQLAQAIWEPLSKNGKAFLSFGPNSGAESAAPVRWDLRIWEEAKREIIVPNNRIIKSLIEENIHFVPTEFKQVFEQMLAHIYAFEKHVENPALDYRDHRFPEEFSRIIDDVCFGNKKHQSDIVKLEKWIVKKIREYELPIMAGFIGGSVLRGFYQGADVDIFILLDNETSEEIRMSGRKLDEFKREFLNNFGRKIHVVAFSSVEETGFNEFLTKLTQKKRFI